MPKRSRTHQLEDISIQCFEQLLPAEWVCRRKDKDYGVDLEVEVFDECGEATGLLFFVQLKATDDIKKERTVSMKVDRLEYLASFDNPSIVVRYCDVSKALHWIWLSNIFAKIATPETETVSVQFEESDTWTDATPLEIIETMKVYRTIRTASRRTPIGLSVRPNSSAAGGTFELNYAVSSILDTCKMVVAEKDGSKCLPVTVWLDGDYLLAEVDIISSIGVHLHRVHRDDILAQLTYILVYMAGRYEFSSQAKNLAQVIVDRRLTCQSREIASSVACLFVDKPSLCAEIASLNFLHDQQDPAYARYIQSLLGSEVSVEEKTDAVKRFYSKALVAHEEQSRHSQSVIHYSYGNFLRMKGDHAQAVRHYNTARKKNPEYLEKEYFLAELAATLYFKRRFSVSARLYAASYELSKMPKTALCAGDAFLFSREFLKSSELYDIAARSDNEFEKTEANLKIWLADWCAEFCERNEQMEMRGVFHRPAVWSDVLEQCLAAEQIEHALAASLLLAFILEDDEKVWTQAISLAVHTKDIQLMLATLSSAIWRCGYEAYTPFRDHLAQNGFKNENLVHFDEIVDHLYTLRTSTGDDGVTMRVVEQHQFDTLVEVPTEV
ncbi:DUF4365 domain-containing protein [Yoonia sp. MH D7]